MFGENNSVAHDLNLEIILDRQRFVAKKFDLSLKSAK